MQDMLQLNFSK